MTEQQAEGGDDRGGSSPPRVVGRGCDGIYLRFDPLILGGTHRGSAQHLRGWTGRRRPGQAMGEWKIGRQDHVVQLLERNGDRLTFGVMNGDSTNPLLLSAKVRVLGQYAFGPTAVHIHPAMCHKVGVQLAIDSGRRWADHLSLCLETHSKVIQCERVSRWDEAIDVLTGYGEPDPWGLDQVDLVRSRLHNKEPQPGGWRVGYNLREGAQQRRVVTAYDKGRERWDKAGEPGLREYMRSLADPHLCMDDAGQLTYQNRAAGISNQAVRITRVEFRFNREYLREQGIGNADEMLPRVAALVQQASQETVMRKPSISGRVYRTNPLTPLWELIQSNDLED